MNGIGLFYKYFINRFGIEIFDKLKDMIIVKIDFRHPAEGYVYNMDFLKLYVAFVFEIALTDYWGFNNIQIKEYIKTVIKDKVVFKMSIGRLKLVHHDAIRIIQKYLEETKNEVQEVMVNEQK